MRIFEALEKRLMRVGGCLPPYQAEYDIWVDFPKDESFHLVDDLLSMVNNREYSDMTFLCKDGCEVHASRMFLAGRSVMFKKMLLNGMSESTSTVIPLPLVASSTLIQVLRYLYAGRSFSSQLSLGQDARSVEREEPNFEGDRERNGLHVTYMLELNEMVNVVAAARFFLLDRLEDDMLKRLAVFLSERNHDAYTEDMLNSVAVGLSNMITLVTDDPTNRRVSVIEPPTLKAILLRLVQILVSHNLSGATISNLSKDAFIFCLKNIRERNPSTSRWNWSLEEYRKLTQVLIWCVRTGGSEDVECLPSTESVARFLRDGDQVELFKSSRPGPLSRPGYPSQVALKDFEILLPDIMKNNFSDLVAMVNLTCIHPDVLLTVVNPSGIIDAEKLTNVLRIQALRDFRWIYQWAIVPRRRQDGFTIPEEDRRYPGVFQIGFFRRLHGEDSSLDDTDLCLSQNPKGWALVISDDAGRATFHGSEGGLGPDWVLPTGKRFEVDKEIEVKLNRVDQTCCFSYDGSSISVVLRKLQGGLVYPAVSFQSRLLKVSMIFRGGFDQHVLFTEEGFKRGELYSDGF
ncbi:hypothetical protein R1sor_014904 [Riccia sorocarpa]|uniref:BTB domain-containing protein n=1 Tax=Riccia sorocarpa TaxID=122646 RepID=A0ABD3HEJ4_9MARC